MTQSEYLSEDDVEVDLDWLVRCFSFTGVESCQQAGDEITSLLNAGWQIEQSIQTSNTAIIIFFRELDVETEE